MTTDLDSQSDSVSPASQRQGTGRSPGTLGRVRFDNGLLPLGKIGRYTVLGQLAGGGMGSVYLALMRGPAAFSRLVAIKCLHTRWVDDPKYVARFTTEVRLTTRIRHPNVVEALDVVEEGGELFLVMEYVDGVTLSALLADLGRLERPLPVELAAGLMAAVLRGLHAAHVTTDEHGQRLDIVHRDVSPQNIMISRSGHVQVLDFGAAKAIAHSQHTAAGVLVGKLAYMAPEQVHGERSSPCTDIFAAGIVLWEALVNRRLFYDPSLARSELLQALVRKPIVRPSRLRPDVPGALDAVVKKALDRNPRQRYQSALELAEALELFAGGAPGERLGSLVREACALRLAEKEELLRVGLEAIEAEPSSATPVSAELPTSRGALMVPAGQHTLPPIVLSTPPRPHRTARWGWVGAALLTGAAAYCWWSGLRLSFEPRSAARPALAPVPMTSPLDPAPEPGPERAAMGWPSPSAPTGVNEVGSGRAGSAPVAPRTTGGLAPRAADPGVDGARDAAGQLAFGNGDSSVSSTARPRRIAQPATAARAASRCDPPTYMDAAGIRHFKKGCL